MTTKRNPGRFTLQFNLHDPAQMAVSNLLDQQGRHKAQYITNAVSYYESFLDAKKEGQNTTAVVTPIDKAIHEITSTKSEQLISSEEHNTIQPDYPLNDESSEINKRLDSMFEETELPAIMNTLAAFSKI